VTRTKQVVFYSLKILTGILIGFVVSEFTEVIDVTWMLISTILVMSPEGVDAMNLAITRIQANLVGAFTGFGLALANITILIKIIIGAIISLIICELLKLTVGSRTALAAMIIVLMNPEGDHPWDASVHRVSSVVIGCFIGLLITWFFHSFLKIVNDPTGKGPDNTVREG
jgi:uncharacterized membrane protein YccC